MAADTAPAPAWLRQRHIRLSTTPLGVIGAGWVLYSVGVLGAVYGFLFLPPRGWGLLQVTGLLVLLLGILVGASELLARSSYTRLAARLDELPFDVAGYPAALGAPDLDTARIELTFADAAETDPLSAAVDAFDADWLRADGQALIIDDARGEGTNWRLHQRVQQTLVEVCAPLSERAELTGARVSASSSSDRTSASAE